MTLPVTVVICTHNPRPDYLQRVLEGLRAQTLPLDEWELIVVDNASERSVAAVYDLSWHLHARNVREEQLGLSFARQRGIREAVGELLVFVDDDNLLSPNYLTDALALGKAWPRLGTWGGSITPEFEIEPAAQLRPYLGYLALREVTEERWANVADCPGTDPWGAGMCVRRRVALAYAAHLDSTDIQLTGRRGRALMSSEDTEICYVSCGLGLGMGIFPQLKVTHLIRHERLNEKYLVGIIEGTGTSLRLIAYKWRRQVPRSPFSGLGPIRVAIALIRHRGLARRVYIAEQRAMVRARRMIGLRR